LRRQVDELLLLAEELAGGLAGANVGELAVEMTIAEASDETSMSSRDLNSVVSLAGLALDCFFAHDFRVFVTRPAFVFVTVGSPSVLDCGALTF
jgi:hypothetical protein